MKIIVFVPTGETRCPKEGEWYLSDNAHYYKARIAFDSEWPIFTRHKIDVPTNAQRFHYQFDEGFKSGMLSLPRPKVKVKRWRWVVNEFSSVFITEGHYTEDELRETLSEMEWYHKIPETEIEVEE